MHDLQKLLDLIAAPGPLPSKVIPAFLLKFNFPREFAALIVVTPEGDLKNILIKILKN
jgi:hypothetical protein